MKKAKKEAAPKVSYEYFFIRNSKYEDALKEAESMKDQGWHLRKWHYEASTLSFILTMERVKDTPKEENTEAGK